MEIQAGAVTPDLMPSISPATSCLAVTSRPASEDDLPSRAGVRQPAAGRRDQPGRPKRKSALLESMAEKHVTVGGETHELDEPFLVVATQNPIEQEGTYPCPRPNSTAS